MVQKSFYHAGDGRGTEKSADIGLKLKYDIVLHHRVKFILRGRIYTLSPFGKTKRRKTSTWYCKTPKHNTLHCILSFERQSPNVIVSESGVRSNLSTWFTTFGHLAVVPLVFSLLPYLALPCPP